MLGVEGCGASGMEVLRLRPSVRLTDFAQGDNFGGLNEKDDKATADSLRE